MLKLLTILGVASFFCSGQCATLIWINGSGSPLTITHPEDSGVTWTVVQGRTDYPLTPEFINDLESWGLPVVDEDTDWVRIDNSAGNYTVRRIPQSESPWSVFWISFGFFFSACLGGVGARWVRRVVVSRED